MDFLDPNSFDIPWIETPFFEEAISETSLSDKLKNHAIEIHKYGYTTIDLDINYDLIDKINIDIEEHVKRGTLKTNPKMYHYNDSPRIVEAWKFSDSIKKIAQNKKLLEFISFLYKKNPQPFNTINFLKGTEQPIHSDYIHFGSIPHFYLMGVWVPLENIHPDSGPLVGVPGSHKLPIIDYNFLNLEIPKTNKKLEECYRVYESFIKKLIENKKLEIKTFLPKKGQAILWAANFLHGAKSMKNTSLTRKSLVFHFHFDGQKYYNPNFSNPNVGDFKYRDINEFKMIL